ncbi:outer membrane protein assembly factor BamB [Zoogloea sp. 1C4]|uniref:outer membrane protein assembly factor BamB n=1 Tax=Zoogloea sp. 1C4 TaxID=2570190 RepID=UPI001291987D|nr:outer membrane protein assembly factor BamB [Zoogloea sp. 1C4]
MKAPQRALIVVAALALGACSSLNPFSSSGKLPALTPITSPVATSEAWRVRVGNTGVYVLQPAIVGDAVFAAGDGDVVRLDNGRVRWKTPLKVTISGGVGSDGSLVVVGTPKGEVIALDANSGQVKWRVPVNAEVLAAPAVSNGLVVVRSADSRLFGLDSADGRQRWVYQRATPPLSLRNSAGVLLESNVILAGFPGGKLAAVSPANGSLMWEGTVAIPRGATELERMSDITSLPVMGSRATCAVAYQGRIACFDMSNGSTLWTRDLSSSKGLDLDDSQVFVTDDKGAVLALDIGSGASAWKQDQLAGRGTGRPRVINDYYVVVGDAEGYVHLLRKDDGRLVGRLRPASSPVLADPQRAGGSVVIQTRDGNVAAVGVQ